MAPERLGFPSIAHVRATARPFNHELSSRLDNVTLQLEGGATGLRRRWLQCLLWWYERQVPALVCEVRK